MRTITVELTAPKKSRAVLSKPTISQSAWYRFWAWSIWTNKKFYIPAFSLVGLLLIVSLLGYILGKPLYDQTQVVLGQVEEIKVSVKDQNIGQLSKQLPEIKASLNQLQQKTQSYSFVKGLPWLGEYYQDSQHALTAADQGLEGGIILVEAVMPYADALGLKSDQSPDNIEATDNEERMAQLVLLMPAILPALEEATTNFQAVDREMSSINPDRYPKSLAGYNVRQLISDAKMQLASLNQGIQDIQPVLEILPQAMGSEQPKRYLLIFQNDKELRPTGGFMSSVAYITFNRGKFEVSESQDIYSIDDGRAFLPVPWPMTAYNNASKLVLRDTNWSPDFAESMADFELYYRRSGHPAVDGFIAVDTQMVEELMKMTGPISVPGYREPFTAEPIDVNGVPIPQVVYQLEVIAQKIGLQGDDRKGVIGDLMKLIIEKVLSDPPTRWPDYLDMVMTVAQEKHLQLNFHDSEIQELAEQHNFAGRIDTPVLDQDYLHINDANLAGLKTNFYLQQKAQQDISIADDGTITKKLTITYTNTGKFDGWISATARNYTRVYVPQGSKLLKSTGGQQKVNTTSDLGYTVFDNFTTVKPLASQTMTFEYTLPFKATASDYKLRLQKQAGAQNWHYTTSLGGQTVETLLDRDVVLKLSR